MMTSVMPDVHERGRYTQGEAAGLLGVSRKTIDRWVAKGVLVVTGVNRNGHKYFSGRELKRCWQGYGRFGC